jgi:1-acyl-sn-glycerol-3-phosphate acyltransferase
MADAKIIQFGSGGPAGRGSRGSPSASARRLAPPQAGRRSRSRADGSAAGAQARTARESRDSERNAPRPESDATPGPEETPRTSVSSVLLSELLGLGSRSLESLKSLPIAQLRALAADPVHALASVAQALGVDWDSSVEEMLAFIRQRLEGDYAVDEFGFDPELTTKIYLPLLRQIADHWFRVEIRGAENLPMDGSALLVSNHAGTLPVDGMILHTVVYDEIGRHVRMLGADLIFKTPYSGDLARKTGTTLACQEDAERLLASNQLVAVFPEGFKGLGKPYADRYKLQRFGRGGFVTAAIRAQVPIIPIAIVGSEEIYPLIAKAPALARALGVPYFPITPLFPWFGPLGMIPLPSKWIIQFGEAITTDELGPGAADDPMTVFNITDQVRETIQQTLYALLMQRRSAFF